MTSLLPFRRGESEIPDSVPLTAREIHGNLVFTGNWVIAWHRATLVQWPFRHDDARKQWMMTAAAQYAQLAGYRIYERVTSRPYPISDWAIALNGRTPNPADLPGDDAWPEYLVRRQEQMYGMDLATKEVYIGVRFNRRDNFAALTERFQGKVRLTEVDRVGREAEKIAAMLRGGALDARPLTGTETEWLVHRSVSLGLPVPYDRDTTGNESWIEDDLAAITDGVFYESSRFGRSVKITSRRADREVSRYVAAVALGTMGGVSAPEVGRAEWLYALDSLPFPVERISTMDVVGPEVTRKHVKNTLLAIRDQQSHYRQHELDIPDDLARKAEMARRIDSDLTDGQPALAVRMVGFHRLAVSGDTEEEAMARIRQVQDLYRNRISVHIPPAQGDILREFVPGEPLRRTTHLRRYNALFHTSGAPLADGDVGDGVGDWIGTLDGSRQRPVLFDPWIAPEVNDSPGMYPVLGTLGAGKSALIAKMIDQALRRNSPTVVFDPSVTFAGLANMDRYKGRAQVIDLHDQKQAPAGILNPFRLIPAPTPSDYADEESYNRDVTRARAERFQLVLDVCQRLLPPSARREVDSDMILRDAIRKAEVTTNPSLHDVVTALNAAGPDGEKLAHLLQDVNDMTVEGRLFFPAADTSSTAIISGALLTVITLGGLQLPPEGTREEDWSMAERVAVPVLALATGFASRLVYSGRRHLRKLLVLDEMHVLATWPSGRALFTRLGRDSRKFNVAVLAAGQNPNDALSLDVQNLIGGAFVGRINDDKTAAEALQLLRIPVGVGYEEVVRSLSPVEDRDVYRQFLMLDVYGRVGLIKVTFDDDPELLEAINTRPQGV